MNWVLRQWRIAAALLIVGSSSGPVRGETPPVEPIVLRKSAALEYDGKKKETMDGLSIKEDPSVKLRHCTDIVISGCELHSIDLSECEHVIIRNCWVHDSKHCGVQTYQCRDVLIEGCRMENISSGVYAMDSHDIRVEGNFVRNVLGPFPRGQMVQFDNVRGSKNAIRENYAINDAGKSQPEDVINLYQSAGESNFPIVVENNYLRGDPAKGSAGKSKTGSGIMLGDKGGAYLLCRHNIVLSAGQVGIGVAGGSFIQVTDNLISGTRSNVSNVGLYAWNQSDKPSHDVVIARNHVHWMDKNGESSDWWEGGGVSELKQMDNHFGDEQLAKEVPSPPSRAPMPPRPFISADAKGHNVVRLPWKP